MTKQLISLVLFIALLVSACATGNTEPDLPTEVVVPTSTFTPVPTHTAVPLNASGANLSDLIIPQTVADNPAEQAYMRIINASTDIGILDVYVEGLAIATNLDYGRFTEREGIVAGSYKLRVLPTGSFVTDSAVYEQEITFLGEQSQILIVTGSVENVTITSVNEPNDPLPDDTSRLLMINAMQGANDLVMLVNEAPQTTITPYLTISETTEYEAGTVNLQIQNLGTALLNTDLDIRERQNYTFVMMGSLDRPDTQVFAILNSEAPGLTEISFINASPSAGLIDVYFGDNVLVGDADYGEISVPQAILSGNYDISIYPLDANPDDIDPITGTQFIANPDEDIVLILVGEADSLRFVVYRNDQNPTFDDQARMTFINGLPSTPTIVLNSTDANLNRRLGYGQLSETFTLSANQSLSLTWIQQLDDVQDIALENFSDFTPTAGQNYLYVFSGRGFEDPILLSLEVGTVGFSAEIEVPPTIEPSRPTRIRLVNMWDGLPFVAQLDGTVIAEGIEAGKATNSLIIPSGEHTITFFDVNTTVDLVELTNTFEVAKSYSLVLYQDDLGDGTVLIIDDSDTTITSATGAIRLIVLDAEPESKFGIGYSEPTQNISQPDASEGYRRSLTLGIQQLIRDIVSGAESAVQRIPIGTHNIRIIDNAEAEIAFTHTEVTIESGVLYNIFLREDERTHQTSTVIVPYSSP